MALGAIIGGAQAALGIGNALFGTPPVDTSAITAAVFRNSAIKLQNERTSQIWQTKLEQTKQQYGRNQDSANRAYSALQLKEQEQLEAYLTQRAGMLKQLVELRGGYNAREVYGKSAARVASQSEREYGTAMRLLHDNMVRFSNQVDRDLAEVTRQQQVANENAWAGISVPPEIMGQTPIPEVQTTSALNTGLQIGGAILGGLSTFASLSPPSSTSRGGGSKGGSPYGTDLSAMQFV